MGWLWSSSPPNDDSSSSSQSTQPDWSLTDPQRQRIFGKPSPSASEFRDAKADKDLETLIASFSHPSQTQPTPHPETSTSEPEPQQPPDQPPSRRLPDGRMDISPHLLHPRTLSCRQAFDQAYYCQSLGGKFKDIYRFGSLQSCSEQWGAFWFCMRTRGLGEEERGEKVAEHFRGREERRGRGSESVWEVRGVSVREAFQRDPDEEGEGMRVEE